VGERNTTPISTYVTLTDEVSVKYHSPILRNGQSFPRVQFCCDKPQVRNTMDVATYYGSASLIEHALSLLADGGKLSLFTPRCRFTNTLA